jgi:hypothetical protein
MRRDETGVRGAGPRRLDRGRGLGGPGRRATPAPDAAATPVRYRRESGLLAHTSRRGEGAHASGGRAASPTSPQPLLSAWSASASHSTSVSQRRRVATATSASSSSSTDETSRARSRSGGMASTSQVTGRCSPWRWLDFAGPADGSQSRTCSAVTAMRRSSGRAPPCAGRTCASAQHPRRPHPPPHIVGAIGGLHARRERDPVDVHAGVCVPQVVGPCVLGQPCCL